MPQGPVPFLYCDLSSELIAKRHTPVVWAVTVPIETKICIAGNLADVSLYAKFKMIFSGVTILQGVEFPIFLLIFAWALQQCSATVLRVRWQDRGLVQSSKKYVFEMQRIWVINAVVQQTVLHATCFVLFVCFNRQWKIYVSHCTTRRQTQSRKLETACWK